MQQQTAAKRTADGLSSMRFCGDASRHMDQREAQALHQSSFGKVMNEVSDWQHGRLVEGSKSLEFGDDRYLVWQIGSECAVLHRQTLRGVRYGSAWMDWKVERGSLKSVVARLKASAKQLRLPLAVANGLA